ncbi:MAG: SDR family oxidoreductase [candidate division NC10 bacterium]|nr:SDR family oxidoreductase [candidate division NC10 bacterium]
MRLQGRVAIVTGGAKGIGWGITQLFAKAGSHIVLIGRSEDAIRQAERHLRDDGIKALACVGDVSKSSDVRQMVAAALQQFGQIDILVNNAGVNPNRGRSVLDTEEADWDAIMAVNLRGMLLCTKAVLPIMKKQRRGHIINMCSIGGKVIRDGKNSAYRTSKFGVRGFTWSLAKDVRDDNISVSAILPGTTQSAMNPNETGDSSSWLSPNDIGEAALFLATREPNVIIPEMIVAPRSSIGGPTCPYC